MFKWFKKTLQDDEEVILINTDDNKILDLNENDFSTELDKSEEIHVDAYNGDNLQKNSLHEIGNVNNKTQTSDEIKFENYADFNKDKNFFNLFKKVFTGLEKTRNNFTNKINEILGNYMIIDDDLYEELEDILITADVGVDTTIKLIDNLKNRIKKEKIIDPSLILALLAEESEKLIKLDEDSESFNPNITPTIVLVVGVNGVGKTTTIGKLANKYKYEGKKVLLVAADTFRAAATEQLMEWARRSNVDIVHQQEGADPAAVVYDAIQAAKARNVDIVLCDTAGRLHNKANLMNELEKIYRIIDQNYPEANKESLVVLDATTGQNALLQAREFKEVAKVSGIVITKLDGTAKGGIILPLINELKVPVVYVGVGEKIDDLQPFDSKVFVNSIFGIKKI